MIDFLEMKVKLQIIMTIITFGSKSLSITSDCELQGWQNPGMYRRYFAAGGSGALHKIDCIVKRLYIVLL